MAEKQEVVDLKTRDKKKKAERHFNTVTAANIHSILKKTHTKPEWRLGADGSQRLADLIVYQLEQWTENADALRVVDKNNTLLPTHVMRAVLSTLPRCTGLRDYDATMHARARDVMTKALGLVKPEKKPREKKAAPSSSAAEEPIIV